jgi:serine/threonine protein kinase
MNSWTWTDTAFVTQKPDNVGFDASGEVKLFDFGLAKRLDPNDKTENQLYLLTGNTGSLRYMAPEVALCEAYDHRVDAYSFGILFWQICSLTTPYMGYSTKMHADRVIRQGYRPKPDSSWPSNWSHLMKECWATDIFSRPEFAHIVTILDEEVADLLRDEGVGMGSIKAKKKKKKAATDAVRLDVDTRISTAVPGSGVRKTDTNIV